LSTDSTAREITAVLSEGRVDLQRHRDLLIRRLRVVGFIRRDTIWFSTCVSGA